MGDVRDGSQMSLNTILNQELTHLDLFQEHEIGDEGTKQLSAWLENNSSLLSLRLKYNKITEVGAGYLAAALAKNTVLHEFQIGGNLIKDVGVESLAVALRTNQSLTKLHVRRAGITDRGVEAVASVLEGNCSLTALSLCGSGITDKGAARLASAVEGNFSVVVLNLWGTFTDETIARKIDALVQRNLALGGIPSNINCGTESQTGFALPSIIQEPSSPESVTAVPSEGDNSDEPVKRKVDSVQSGSSCCCTDESRRRSLDTSIYNASKGYLLPELKVHDSTRRRMSAAVAASVFGLYNSGELVGKVLVGWAFSLWIAFVPAPFWCYLTVEALCIAAVAFILSAEEADVCLASRCLAFAAIPLLLALREPRPQEWPPPEEIAILPADTLPAEHDSVADRMIDVTRCSNLWAVTVRDLRDFRDEILEDLLLYCSYHGLHTAGKSCTHVCLCDPCPFSGDHRGAPFKRLCEIPTDQEIEKLEPDMHLVVSREIQPRTQSQGSSYALMRRAEGLAANTFVSHAWSQNFGDFVESLLCALDLDDSVWVCSFAMKQNEQHHAFLDNNWLADGPLSVALRSCKRCLLVVDPDVALMERAWCLLEIQMASVLGIPTCLHVHHKTSLALLKAKVQAVSLENAQATKRADSHFIKEILTSKDGCSRIDSRIRAFVEELLQGCGLPGAQTFDEQALSLPQGNHVLEEHG